MVCSPLSVRYSAIKLEMTYVVITKKEKVEKMCRVARCLKVHWLDFKKYDVGKRPDFRLFRKRSGCLAHRLMKILLHLGGLLRLMMV